MVTYPSLRVSGGLNPIEHSRGQFFTNPWYALERNCVYGLTASFSSCESAFWKPGSDHAKVYVHLTNDDVNQAIRDEYGITGDEDTRQQVECPFRSTTNQASHSECRRCGRPLSLEQVTDQEEQHGLLEQLERLEEKGLLDKLDDLLGDADA